MSFERIIRYLEPTGIMREETLLWDCGPQTHPRTPPPSEPPSPIPSPSYSLSPPLKCVPITLSQGPPHAFARTGRKRKREGLGLRPEILPVVHLD